MPMQDLMQLAEPIYTEFALEKDVFNFDKAIILKRLTY